MVLCMLVRSIFSKIPRGVSILDGCRLSQVPAKWRWVSSSGTRPPAGSSLTCTPPCRTSRARSGGRSSKRYIKSSRPGRCIRCSGIWRRCRTRLPLRSRMLTKKSAWRRESKRSLVARWATTWRYYCTKLCSIVIIIIGRISERSSEVR